MAFWDLPPKAQDFLAGKTFCGAVGMANLFAPLSCAPHKENPLRAYHVMFTGPHFSFHGDKPFFMSPHELWTARLSALCWRRYNGPIHLITDPEGARYFHEIGLDQVYDSVIADLWDPYGLNQKKFWASGKLLALQRLECPCVILDMDLIVWQPLPVEDCVLAAAHTEPITDEFYPGKDFFLMSSRYQFPQDWDFEAEPLNTSLFYLNAPELKELYLREAFRFMQQERGTPDNGCICMIFAEQRLLAICARKLGIPAKTFLDTRNILAPQNLITHTWNAKSLLSAAADVEEVFLHRCREVCGLLEEELTKSTDTE